MPNVDTSFAKDFSPAQFEALAEVMALAAEADGEFSAEERAHLEKVLSELASDALSRVALERALKSAQGAAEAGGRLPRLKELRAVLPGPEACRGALALAIELTAADGLIRTSERELILEAADALGVASDEAADLVRQLGA
jgi:tellurite resistance protein